MSDLNKPLNKYPFNSTSGDEWHRNHEEFIKKIKGDNRLEELKFEYSELLEELPTYDYSVGLRIGTTLEGSKYLFCVYRFPDKEDSLLELIELIKECVVYERQRPLDVRHEITSEPERLIPRKYHPFIAGLAVAGLVVLINVLIFLGCF